MEDKTHGHSTEGMVIAGLVGILIGIWIGAKLVESH